MLYIAKTGKPLSNTMQTNLLPDTLTKAVMHGILDMNTRVLPFLYQNAGHFQTCIYLVDDSATRFKLKTKEISYRMEPLLAFLGELK